MRVHGEVADALDPRGGVGLAGRVGEGGAALDLAQAGGLGMLPGEMAEGAEARAGIKEFFLTVDVDDGDIIVEL